VGTHTAYGTGMLSHGYVGLLMSRLEIGVQIFFVLSAHTPHEVALEYSSAAGLVRHGLGTMFMPASEAGRFRDLRAVHVRPAVVWTIYLASAEQGQIGPASAKLAELLLASAGATSTP
jgi:DNA-binding transcriptional LysR family regulator